MPHTPTAHYPVCPHCSQHVELESAATNENGQAVHEECHASKISKQIDYAFRGSDSGIVREP
jgi:hypothetical protein